MLSEADLIGVWRLISHLNVEEDGATSEGPLGPYPKGILIYDEKGHMSVSMMRTDCANGASSGQAKPPTTYLGYSGRWRLMNGTVVHEIEVSSHLYMVNTKQIREVVLDNNRLTLYATIRIGERVQRRVLKWLRA
jgi:hypothetical protein